jgi:hypothetical protein
MQKRTLNVTVLFLLIFILILNCAKVNYVGKTFPPTKNIDIYYSKKDIKKSYVIIGHAIGSGGFLVSDDEIFIELIREAMFKGADGIIIESINKSNDNPENSSERLIKADHLKYK